MPPPPFDLGILLGLEEDVLIIVLELYRNDIAETKSQSDTTHNDDFTAIEMYLDEVESNLRSEKDRRIAASITDARIGDVNAIEALINAEKQDVADRELARKVAR